MSQKRRRKGALNSGRNKFKSCQEQLVKTVRTPKDNIDISLSGLWGPGKLLEQNDSIENILHLLFTEDILADSMKYTNVKISLAREKYKDKSHACLKGIDTVELRAFIGLLFYTEAFISCNEDIHTFFIYIVLMALVEISFVAPSINNDLSLFFVAYHLMIHSLGKKEKKRRQ